MRASRLVCKYKAGVHRPVLSYTRTPPAIPRFGRPSGTVGATAGNRAGPMPATAPVLCRQPLRSYARQRRRSYAGSGAG
jgi:hypothetical protein